MKTKICIDAGHGGGAPGAVNGAYKEKVAALSIAKKLRDKLQMWGFEVIMTRTSDKDVTLKERCDIANKNNVDAFISVHLNAAEAKAAHGIETWKFYKTGAFTRVLADNIQEQLIIATKAKSRGVKESNNFYVLKNTKCPAALVECGFISNDAECEKLFNSAYQDNIANGIAAGIVRSFAK